MTLVILVFFGGMLSILSPCILPVIPFVFARGDRPFVRTGLPLLAGMAVSFAAVATLAAVAGGWAVEANQVGRWLAIGVLGLFAAMLLSERLAGFLSRPLVRLGDRLWHTAEFGRRPSDIGPSLLLGVATGLLWAPCAGPILGLVLTTAALNGASVATSVLLLAYAAGAALALGVILFAGTRVLGALKQRLGLGAWVRRGLGAAVLVGVAAVATGTDVDLLARATFVDTSSAEQWLIDTFGAHRGTAAEASGHESAADATASGPRALLTDAVFRTAEADLPALVRIASGDGSLPVGGRMPGFSGATEWLNSGPLSAESLRGKVVLVEFWTYACINCRHVLPHVKEWAAKYRDAGLVVVGVHTPELAFEKVTGNVRNAVAQLGVTYPVAIDTNSSIWRAWGNQFWPANYFVDARGRIRYHHFGEEDYANQERVIQQLLAERGTASVQDGVRAAASE